MFMKKFKQPKKPERNVEEDQLSFIEQTRSVEIAEIDAEFDEKSVGELNAELDESKLLILGEMHGVKENADVIYTLFKKFGFKKLALEWDTKLYAQVEKFLQTGELDFEAIQDSPDGRITAGHFALLKKLKDEGLLEALVCFDEKTQSGEWDDREANMAKNILVNVSDSKTLVVAGNLHAQVEPMVFDETVHHPMGENVKKQIPTVPSGTIRYLTGQYHNYGVKDFREKSEGVDLSKAKFFKSDEGIYMFELPEAHAAVVPNPKEGLPDALEEQRAETLESVLGSIMTSEQYAETWHETPYIFELKAGDKELLYFGTPHVFDSQDPLFAKIEEAFNKTNPDMVFVEGMSNLPKDKAHFDEILKASREETIDKNGERGFTLKLAAERGIDWHSPEPSDEDLYENLLAKGFSKDEVFAWEVFQILTQYNLQMNRQGFKQYVERFIEGFKQTTNWENFDYSYERAIELGEQILGRPIDVENEPNANDFTDPIPWEEKKESQTILNRISSASGLLRDRKIVSDILEAFKNHNRIFVVYGSSHAAMQEPALKKAFESALNTMNSD